MRPSISVRAGDGGSGCVAFRREKFVPRGGPSGGDGGRGGHIHMQASMRHNTLIQYRYKRVFRARRGTHGLGSKCHGKDAPDLTLTVPVGTIVRDVGSGELVHDFLVADEKILLCRGGRGGRGNAQFASSVNQAPRRFEYGFPGESRRLKLELRLLADVGLVGFPNVGKSTLISRLSAARPKIANYPFTTLEPNLGVVELEDYRSFVVADIPGLIAGAHLGQGLGIQFLRHIERTKVLLHLVDLAGDHGRDPAVDYETVNRETGRLQSGNAPEADPGGCLQDRCHGRFDSPGDAEQSGTGARPGLPLHFRGYRPGSCGSQDQNLGNVGETGRARGAGRGRLSIK